MSRIQLSFICPHDRCLYFKQTRTRSTWRAWGDLSPVVKGEATVTVGEGANCSYCKKHGEAR